MGSYTGNDADNSKTATTEWQWVPPGYVWKSWTMKGMGADDYLVGGAKNDILYGDYAGGTVTAIAGNDSLYGGSGNDFLYGEAGNDLLDGGTGNDALYAGSDNDLLDGWIGNDKLYGGSGNDELLGYDGSDILVGEAGDDTLVGEAGYDTLTGGTGADKFVFNFLSDGIDFITDFKWFEDTVQISMSGFGATSTSQFTYNNSTGALFFGNAQFALLQPNLGDGFIPDLDITLV